jgi:hypothetical protein
MRTSREPQITAPAMEGSDEEYEDQDTQANANDDIDDNDDDNSSAIHFPPKATRYHQDEEDLAAPSVDSNYLYLLPLMYLLDLNYIFSPGSCPPPCSQGPSSCPWVI